MESAVTLLPLPLSPTRQTVSPASMLNETSSTARTAFSPVPNSSLRFLISSNGMDSIPDSRWGARLKARTEETRSTYRGYLLVFPQNLPAVGSLVKATSPGS